MKKVGAMRQKAVIGTIGVLGLVLVLLYLQGVIGGHKVPPGNVPLGGGGVGAESAGETVVVVRREVEDYREWSGTVRSRTVGTVSSVVMARVLDVAVEVGDTVRMGDVLATLDDRDLRARMEQARSALAAAEAQATGAESEYARVQGLYEGEAATKRDLEAAEARAKAARAEADRARDAVFEAEVVLGEAEVVAPMDGVVTERLVEPGDVAVPGRAAFVVQDPERLRLEAEVPETCAAKAVVGEKVRVRIEALDADLTARIDEISPVADPTSRSFLLKASLPSKTAVRAGMFGRFLQPCGRREAILLPRTAVSRLGQLETVTVAGKEGASMTRHVKTGKVFGDEIEILSGLREGEVVDLPPGPTAR